jgi:hypothetical protein
MPSYRIYYFFILLFVFVGGCRTSEPYPTDEFLERQFFSNKADFEKLVQMFSEDSNLFKVDAEKGTIEWADNKGEPPKYRLIEYKKLLSKLNLKLILRYTNNKEIYLLTWHESNSFVGGKSKYFVFSENDGFANPKPSLDEIYKSGKDANDQRKIEGNWYLYLDVW